MFKNRAGRVAPALTFIALTLTTGCGGDTGTASGSGHAGTTGAEPSRTIELTLEGTRYTPARIDVRTGETIRFRITNKDQIRHEATFGTAAQQEQHAKEMAAKPTGADAAGHDMSTGTGAGGHGKGGPHMVVIEAGQTVEANHTFSTTDTVLIGCHQPGHYEAGMRAEVRVAS